MIKIARIGCIAIAASALTTFAATEREYIWPKGMMPDAQPHQVGATTAEMKAPGFNADDYRQPYLDWFDPPAADTSAAATWVSWSSGAGSSPRSA